MTNLTPDKADLGEQVGRMVREGKTFSDISKELGVSWNEARSLAPTSSWHGVKRRTSHLLTQIEKEHNPVKRKEMVAEVRKNVDFLYDAANHLKSQVDNARKALDR